MKLEDVSKALEISVQVLPSKTVVRPTLDAFCFPPARLCEGVKALNKKQDFKSS